MPTPLRIEFSPPRLGWIQLALRSGPQALHLLVSYVPFDSLQDIASAVSGLLECGRRGVARINSEPDEHVLVFEPGASPDSLRLTVVRGSEVLLLHEGNAPLLGRTIWRAFRKLESQFVSAHWVHAFPSKIVSGLDRLTERAQRPEASPTPSSAAMTSSRTPLK